MTSTICTFFLFLQRLFKKRWLKLSTNTVCISFSLFMLMNLTLDNMTHLRNLKEWKGMIITARCLLHFLHNKNEVQEISWRRNLLWGWSSGRDRAYYKRPLAFFNAKPSKWTIGGYIVYHIVSCFTNRNRGWRANGTSRVQNITLLVPHSCLARILLV